MKEYSGRKGKSPGILNQGTHVDVKWSASGFDRFIANEMYVSFFNRLFLVALSCSWSSYLITPQVLRGGLISLWLYKENNKLRD
jgi:hypothetical protein